MFLQNLFLGLLEIFIIINIINKYQVKSEAEYACREEESERLLLKRKEFLKYVQRPVYLNLDNKTKSLAKKICDYLFQVNENMDYEQYDHLETLKRALDETNNENVVNNDVLPEEEIPEEIQEPEITDNHGTIKFTINDVSDGEIYLPTEEEANPEKSCNQTGYNVTKNNIKKILASFIKSVPLKVLIQQKLKEEQKSEEQPLQKVTSLKQQKQEEIIPRFMFQQGYRRFG